MLRRIKQVMMAARPEYSNAQPAPSLAPASPTPGSSIPSAAGSRKLIGGQMEDLLGEKAQPSAERLDFIHHNKTAALITASLLLGLRLTNAKPAKFKIMAQVGQNLGLAFQAIDDILDATASAEVLGKTPGLDQRHGKLTYASLYGLEVAREKARKLTRAAVRGAEKLGGNNWFLLELIRELEHRVN